MCILAWFWILARCLASKHVWPAASWAQSWRCVTGSHSCHRPSDVALQQRIKWGSVITGWSAASCCGDAASAIAGKLSNLAANVHCAHQGHCAQQQLQQQQPTWGPCSNHLMSSAFLDPAAFAAALNCWGVMASTRATTYHGYRILCISFSISSYSSRIFFFRASSLPQMNKHTNTSRSSRGDRVNHSTHQAGAAVAAAAAAVGH